MFGSIGGPELLVIFAIALLIFGPRRLSEIGRTLGKGIAEFRKAATDMRNTLDAEVARAELKPSGEPAADGPPAKPVEAPADDAQPRDERT